MKIPRTIIIDAHRWFEKVNGNTYHSVSVSADFGKGFEPMGIAPFAYGYGDQYLCTAFEIMKKCGLFKSMNYTDFLRHKADNRKNFYVTVTDVPRKKDLRIDSII